MRDQGVLERVMLSMFILIPLTKDQGKSEEKHQNVNFPLLNSITNV